MPVDGWLFVLFFYNYPFWSLLQISKLKKSLFRGKRHKVEVHIQEFYFTDPIDFCIIFRLFHYSESTRQIIVQIPCQSV